jgi:hypothetical protein
VPYGKVWRTGANEATEIKFYQDVDLGGKKVKAGSYSLFTIPGEKEWVGDLNTDLDYWGAYKYNEKNDVRSSARLRYFVNGAFGEFQHSIRGQG